MLSSLSAPDVPTPSLKSLKGDLEGALLGAINTLPQAVAYGLIAVAPLGSAWASFGIMTSVGSAVLFCIVVGGFNSNHHLISGPRAITALVIATALNQCLMRGHGPDSALMIAFTGVALGGVIQFLFGVAKLGRLVSYVPVPVLIGFVTSSALIVIVHAIPSALGSADPLAIDWPLRLAAVNPLAVASCAITVLVTLSCENRLRGVPSALPGLLLGAAVYHIGNSAFGLPASPVVGPIEFGAAFQIPVAFATSFPLPQVLDELDIILTVATSVALLASFDTVLGSAALNSIIVSSSNHNQELRVHGLANTLMGGLGLLPGQGTIARSLAVYNAGGRTRLANIGTGIVFALTLYLLTPAVSQLPLAATAGMLIATGIQAIDRSTVQKLNDILFERISYRRLYAGDVAVTLLVVVTALVFDLMSAIAMGIFLSIALFVIGVGGDPIRRAYQCTRVHSNVQRLPSEMEYLEREGHRIGVVELRGALFFGVCDRLLSRVNAMLANGVQTLILDFRHLTSVDSSVAKMLLGLDALCKKSGALLALSCLEQERRRASSTQPAVAVPDERRSLESRSPRWVWLSLEAHGVIDGIGPANIFDNTDTALTQAEDRLLADRADRERRRQGGRRNPILLLQRLDREQVELLGGYVTSQEFENDQVVFEQGESGDTAFLLASGRMDVLMAIPGSTRKRRLSVLRPGAIFGEMALTDGSPRSASVVSVGRSRCYSISRESFSALEREHPAIVLTLVKNLNLQLSARLRIANTMISELEQQ